jgi:phosphinothricin acetyltransferase
VQPERLSPGRAALRFTAEISYYIATTRQRQGVGTALLEHALAACPALGIRHLFAIVLESNEASLKLLRKMGFEQWGYLPGVADFDGREVGHHPTHYLSTRTAKTLPKTGSLLFLRRYHW